jgi:hypothetical protein
VRFLPATLVIIVMGPVSGRLTDRVGPRPLIALGLAIVGAALLIQSQLTIDTGYGLLLPGFILMGLGIGLVMSPMSTAAMNAVDRTKSGAASGVVSMSRMVGGTVGLAAMGAFVATIGRSKLDSSLPQLPAPARAKLASTLGSGAAPDGHASPHVLYALHHAFVAALATGLRCSAVVAFVGALLALWLVRPGRRQHAGTRPSGQRAPEAITAWPDACHSLTNRAITANRRPQPPHASAHHWRPAFKRRLGHGRATASRSVDPWRPEGADARGEDPHALQCRQASRGGGCGQGEHHGNDDDEEADPDDGREAGKDRRQYRGRPDATTGPAIPHPASHRLYRSSERSAARVTPRPP